MKDATAVRASAAAAAHGYRWRGAVLLALALALTALFKCCAVDGPMLLGQSSQPEQPRGGAVPPPVPGQVGYPTELFARGNRTSFAVESMLNGLLQVVALGTDGQVWHTFEVEKRGKWRGWAQLTTACPSAVDRERPCFFDGDPAIGRNADGRLEVFMRFAANLDMWQMHQLDAKDPTSWSMPREGSCVDQDQATSVWYCLDPGFPAEQTYAHYFIIHSPAFSTSDLSVVRDAASDKLQVSSYLDGPKGPGTRDSGGRWTLTECSSGALAQVFFRNFEGHLYMLEQLQAGDSGSYSVPQLVAPNILFI